MFYLIEDTEQLKVFYNSGYKQAYIEIISNNDSIHPTINDLCAVYIRPLGATKGYMLAINHSEAINVKKEWVSKILSKFDVLYCKDKKLILHYFILSNLEDILITSKPLEIESLNVYSAFNHIYNKQTNINQLIPIVKHYEWCESIYNAVKHLITQPKTKYYEFYNNKSSVVFNAIERTGIRINPKLFSEYFHDTDSERVYTQYNLNTLTTRPSNKFNSVNYASLNKENGCRKSFIPSNDKFVEMDISAYHPNLSCHLIDYSFPTVDIHSHLQKLYGVSYKESKELTFKQLYGGVFKQYKHLEFFSKIDSYVKETWDKFNKDGFIECPVSGFMYVKEELDNMNPQKLFNYFLLNLETSTNILILWDIFNILKGCNTKLILYTFDSFLFDFDESEVEVLDKIREVFLKYKLSIKEIEGKNYGEMG